MKKNIELLMAKQFAELAVCNLDAVMKDDSLTDKEFNAIREAHDSIASARDTIERLTKPQRMVSAETKENGYGESEDERVREDILAFVKREGQHIDKYKWHKWIAWLEKQGSEPNWCHHKVDLSNCSEEYRKAYYDGWNNCNQQHSQCKSESNDVVKCIINGMKFYYEGNEEATWGTEKFSMKVKDILFWLEKQGQKKYIDDLTQQEAMDIAVAKCFEQGGQKPVIEMKTPEESLGIDSETYNEVVNDCIFGENKPKFKVGDWVVHDISDGRKVIRQIISMTNKSYILDGEDFNTFYFNDLENDYHLWSIEDAKPGDVLHSTGWHNDCIFIFNGLDNWKFDEPNGDRAVATGYCCLFVSADNMEFGIQGPDCVEVNTIKPATKIQRDLLFRKMKVSGYEWDAKNKELNKIHVIDEGKSEMDYCFTKMMNGEKVNLIWSEEDEKHIKELESLVKQVWVIAEHENDKETIQKMSDLSFFLKTLKPHLKQEWKQENREELTEFENAMMHIGRSFFEENAGLDPNDTDKIKEQAELLLELAPKTEWSEEDERNLRRAIRTTKVVYPVTADWLESIKQRHTWKPSYEQMEVLVWCRTLLIVPKLKGILESLINDLKKLKGE